MKREKLVFKSENVSIYEFVNKLIDDCEGSAFFPDCYHEAIIGINDETRSIVYSLDKIVELEIALRFEEGGLNSEYDELDDDILLVCQDSVLKSFQMYRYREEGILPTLYDETTESVIDLAATIELGNTINRVFGEELSRSTAGLDMPSKIFTYDQLSEIVSDNDAEYLRWIELRQFNPNSSFELVPRELMDFDDDEPIIRTVVKLVDEPYWLGFQDLTFDQWELGNVVDGNQDVA